MKAMIINFAKLIIFVATIIPVLMAWEVKTYKVIATKKAQTEMVNAFINVTAVPWSKLYSLTNGKVIYSF